MRFDDSLRTILASDAAAGFGAQATWRQLVDLAGRRRIAADAATIARLRSLRPGVAPPVRAASARALAFAAPPAALVALFAEDEPAIAAPVLRTAMLSGEEWLALLPALTQIGRSVLRHRRDLPPEAVRGLASFGTVDFVLEHEAPAEPAPAPATAPTPAAPAGATPSPAAPRSTDTPFQPVGDILRRLPILADPPLRPEPDAALPPPDRFEIADLKARIDAYRRDQPPPAASAVDGETFRFETDAAGIVRWVEGVARATLVGVSLARRSGQGLVAIEPRLADLLRMHACFTDVGLTIGGGSPAAGRWQLSAVPAFEPSSGRFAGYRGVGRRAPAALVAAGTSDSLRQLVHELRTPANAIAGFAELIETQLLGPVVEPYRSRAGLIRRQTGALLAAIDDLDTAARVEGRALDLRPAALALEPLVARHLAELAPLAERRRAALVFEPAGEHRVHVDERLGDRLVGRLLAAVLAVAAPGERLRVKVKAKADGSVALQIDRPAALAAVADDGLFGIDADAWAEGGEAMPPLGVGFALRLVRNLAAELGGGLAVGPARLTLRLPAALDREVEQAAR